MYLMYKTVTLAESWSLFWFYVSISLPKTLFYISINQSTSSALKLLVIHSYYSYRASNSIVLKCFSKKSTVITYVTYFYDWGITGLYILRSKIDKYSLDCTTDTFPYTISKTNLHWTWRNQTWKTCNVQSLTFMALILYYLIFYT